LRLFENALLENGRFRRSSSEGSDGVGGGVRVSMPRPINDVDFERAIADNDPGGSRILREPAVGCGWWPMVGAEDIGSEVVRDMMSGRGNRTSRLPG